MAAPTPLLWCGAATAHAYSVSTAAAASFGTVEAYDDLFTGTLIGGTRFLEVAPGGAVAS